MAHLTQSSQYIRIGSHGWKGTQVGFFLCFIDESLGNCKVYKFLVGRYIRITKKRLTDEEWKRGREALSGLLKRRGYSRPNADGEDLTPLENVRADVFAAHPAFSTYFSEVRSLAEQWEEFTANISNVEKFLGDSNIPPFCPQLQIWEVAEKSSEAVCASKSFADLR